MNRLRETERPFAGGAARAVAVCAREDTPLLTILAFGDQAFEDLVLLLQSLKLVNVLPLEDPSTPLLGSLEQGSAEGITVPRLWTVMKRFFSLVADVVQEQSPATAEKLRRASPHWMRHTHATHALERGVDLTTVRDHLRHASLSTTSIYLHTDEEKRARQLGAAFSGQPR